jgi:Dyp-type peroxidase family
MVKTTNSTGPVIKLSQSKLDINALDLSVVFEDIQGNILKSHGRSHSRHLFIQFTSDADRNQKWLGRLAPKLTSALEQHRTALDFKESGKEHLFTGFMLSYSGFQALGIEDQKIPDDKAFRAGMKDVDFRYDTGPGGSHKRTINPLNDTPANWEEPFKENIDGLIILAYGGRNSSSDKCEAYLNEQVEKVKTQMAGIATILTIEKGYVLRNESEMVIEHFGFADGVSNPVFFKSDFQRCEDQEKTDLYDPSAPFGLIAVNDLGGQDINTSFGSYFVYRKMQQNIKGFSEQTKQFASLLSDEVGREIDQEYAGALVFGRFKDGTPVTINSSETKKPLFNNFNYDDDTEGLKCPFQSHIRKTNPRGDTNRKSRVPLASERGHRIARRGISYGSKDMDPSSEWTDSGLLFLSCQSDIEQQFLLMQCAWSDNSNFLIEGTGTDPITGEQNTGADKTAKKWQLQIDKKKVSIDFSYRDIVKIRGGEYFFAPSISFCKKFM